jgi:predicted transcriptional regulator
MEQRRHPRVVNQLPTVLVRLGVSWGELSRRTLLPLPLLSRLRASDANPRLAIAERVAAALGVPVERLWRNG